MAAVRRSCAKTMSAARRATSRQMPFLRTSNVCWDAIDLTEVDAMAIRRDDAERRRRLRARRPARLRRRRDRLAQPIWDGRSTPACAFQNHLHRFARRTASIRASTSTSCMQRSPSSASSMVLATDGNDPATCHGTRLRGASRCRIPPLRRADADRATCSCDVQRSDRAARRAVAMQPQDLKRAAMRDAVHTRAAGRGAEGNRDRPGAGELGRRSTRRRCASVAVRHVTTALRAIGTTATIPCCESRTCRDWP